MFIFIFTAGILAQSTGINGVVIDTHNAVIAGATVVLRIKKLKMPQVVRIASEHNKRVRFQSHPVALRSTRSGQSGESGNECLYGPATPEEVADRARQLMEKSGVARLRKDAVRAIEIMISLSSGHSINDRDFFVDSMYWFAERL